MSWNFSDPVASTFQVLGSQARYRDWARALCVADKYSIRDPHPLPVSYFLRSVEPGFSPLCCALLIQLLIALSRWVHRLTWFPASPLSSPYLAVGCRTESLVVRWKSAIFQGLVYHIFMASKGTERQEHPSQACLDEHRETGARQLGVPWWVSSSPCPLVSE